MYLEMNGYIISNFSKWIRKKECIHIQVIMYLYIDIKRDSKMREGERKKVEEKK